MLETYDLSGVNPKCGFCHGEGFRRMPRFGRPARPPARLSLALADESKWLYDRVACAACFTLMTVERITR